MKVLIADTFESSGIDGLEAAGCDVIYQPDLKDEALAGAIRETGADVLVVRSTAVTEGMLDAGRLSLVVRAGAGYNTIAVAAASARGIYVSTCPGRNAIAVAELAFGLILAVDRRIPDNVIDLRAGRWNKKEYAKARGLHGRTLALLGAGSIGVEMVRRALAFGLEVVIWSRRFHGRDGDLTEGDARASGLEFARHAGAVTLAPTPAAAAARCDILSVHLALVPETRGLVNAEVLGRLRPGAYLVNTARAEVVDAAALERAVRERSLRVALDVFDREPAGATGDFADPVVMLPGVYGTHHIGAATEQAQEAIAAETVRIVRTYLRTGTVPNVVNLARQTPARHMLVVRHRDRPGVLAHVFDHLRAGHINVQETENVVFEGAQAAVARINLDREPEDALLKAMRAGNPNILDLHLVQIEA
jgi:D-3-phosphoglycerate dehydrogenase / 2-oxoglutarate reductase